MAIEANKATLRKGAEDFNRGDLDAYLELYAPDVVLRGYPPDLPPGRAGARAFYATFLKAFPDAQFHADEVVAEGDTLAVRYTVRGTHRGDLMGIPPTGKPVAFTSATFLRFAHGRCVERWADVPGVMASVRAQLGVTASPAPAAAQR